MDNTRRNRGSLTSLCCLAGVVTPTLDDKEDVEKLRQAFSLSPAQLAL